MDRYGMIDAEQRIDAEDARQLPEDARQLPEARRHAFWSGVADFLLSIPPGIMVRLGG